MSDDSAGNAGHLEPPDSGFVPNRWLHPSMYTAVPDPSRPPGYETAVRAKIDAQQAILRDAEQAMRASTEPQAAPSERETGPGTDDDWRAYIEEHYREQQAEQRAQDEYMRYIAQVAEGRGQTLDEFIALNTDPEPEAEL
jgi:hypothetical protein